MCPQSWPSSLGRRRGKAGGQFGGDNTAGRHRERLRGKYRRTKLKRRRLCRNTKENFQAGADR